MTTARPLRCGNSTRYSRDTWTRRRPRRGGDTWTYRRRAVPACRVWTRG